MLTLRIIAGETAVSLNRSEVPLTQGRISIGRAPNSDVTLDDPAVSRLHCLIESDGDGCIVHDQSSNGVLVNNEKHPVGKGKSRRLSVGDRLRIGLYIVEICRAEDEADAQLSRFSALFSDKEAALPPPPSAFQRSFGKDDDFDAFPRSFDIQNDPPTAQLGRGVKLSWGDDHDGDDDHLAELGLAKPWRRESVPAADDHAPADVHVFVPPPLAREEAAPPFVAPPASSAGVIGDDWDDELDETWVNRPLPPPGDVPQAKAFIPPDDAPLDDIPDNILAPILTPIPIDDAGEEEITFDKNDVFSRSDTMDEPGPFHEPSPAVPPVAPEPPASHVEFIAPVAPPRPPADNAAELIAAFFEGVGASPPTGSSWGPEDMRRAGRLVREAVTGLAAVLDGRAAVRADLLGVSNTRWEADKDNNPLKFIRKQDELLQRALAPKTPDYLDGPAAVREALRDVRAHEMAMVNAVQTAGRSLVETFQPEKLKTRLEASGSFTGLFAVQRKARYWETYELLYASMARDLLDGVHAALGERIAQEYEHSLRELEKEEPGR
jgi:type VI secretion system protein